MPCILLQSPGNHHNSPIICLTKIPKMVCSSYISIISIIFFVISLSIPLNKKHQVSNKENTQIDSSLLQNKNASSYNNSAGNNTMSRCQRTKEFRIIIRAILYYVNMTTYNRINWKCPRILIMHFYWLILFHIQICFCARLYLRVTVSSHPVTYSRQFCSKNPVKNISLNVSTTHDIIRFHIILRFYRRRHFSCHPVTRVRKYRPIQNCHSLH